MLVTDMYAEADEPGTAQAVLEEIRGAGEACTLAAQRCGGKLWEFVALRSIVPADDTA